MTPEQLRAALQHPNVRAFLRVVRAGETHETDDEAYSAFFGWRPGNGVTFSTMSDHPRHAIKSPWGWTSAAGAYQAMCAVPPLVKTDTWGDFVRWCAPHGYAPTFEPPDQDLFAVWCIRRRSALEDVLAGRIEDAIRKCAKEWASLPGSPYGQPTITMDRALAVYRKWAGEPAAEPASSAAPEPVTEAPEPAQPTAKDRPMAPIIAALLPSIIEAIPRLGKLFGSGSQVAERNIKAAELVVSAVTQATGAVNAQDAVTRLQTDPAAVQVATKAVDALWFELTEAGGGGIDGARKAAREYAMPDGPRFWLNPAFWISMILLAMPMMLLVDVFYVHPESYTGEIRTQIVTGVLMVISMVGAYWIGTSFSSARKDERNRAPQ